MFSLIKRGKILKLDIDVMLYLFDSLVAPILLYGSEVWGANVNFVKNTELLHRKFCKILLNVKSSTTNCMVYGELGRRPLSYNIEMRMICFWFRLVTGPLKKFSRIFLTVITKLNQNNVFYSKWICTVKNILEKIDLGQYWLNPDALINMTLSSFKNICHKKLLEYYNKAWAIEKQNSPKCYLYNHFNNECALKPYLLKLSDFHRKNLVKLRTCNHRLPIEQGRFVNVERKNRICKLCDVRDLGDEYHYILVCSNFKSVRKDLIPYEYYNKPSVYKFCKLMMCKEYDKQLAVFANIIFDKIH